MAGYASVHDSVSYGHKLAKHGNPPSVAVVNGVGFHMEVYSALLWSFQRAGSRPEAFVLTEATSSIEDVISDWYAVQRMHLRRQLFMWGRQ